MFKINATAFPCNRSTAQSWGYDLRASVDTSIGGNQTKAVGTGVYLQLGDNVMAMVCSRSGLARHGVWVANAPGIIDPDYTGEVMVILHNSDIHSYQVRAGDKIAQLVFVKAMRGDDEVETERNGGLGSTGK